MNRTRNSSDSSPFQPVGSVRQDRDTLGVGELIFIGVGGIIGAGFFLGSGLPIQMAGPSVVLSFIIGALLTAQVTGALTSIAELHPVTGSFKVFADLYIGPFAGYMQGWIYYLSSVLIIASEAVAMGVFTRMWIPFLPIWVSSLLYSMIILLINALGVKGFGRIESAMSAAKIAAIVGFILFSAMVMLPIRSGVVITRLATVVGSHTWTFHSFFPHGFSGVLQSMLIVVFAYAGIGVFATAAAKVKNPRVIDRSALWTIVLLSVLYLASIGMLVSIQPWNTLGTASSPFVAAFEHHGWTAIAAAFNVIILIAAFSVMAGAVFSANQILFNLGQSREAPRFVTRQSRQGVAYGALAFTAGGVFVAITAAYLLPSNIYNFLISASSFMTFFYWFMVLWTFLLWRKSDEGRSAKPSPLVFGAPYGAWTTMVVLVILTGYALLQRDQRIAFYAFLAMMLIVSASYLWVRRRTGT